MSKPTISPRSRPEEVAIFRAQVIARLCATPLNRGELQPLLKELSEATFRPPGSEMTVRFSIATLERWYYAFQKHGLEGLIPESRKRGHAQDVPPDELQFLFDAATDDPRMPISVIHQAMVRAGMLQEGAVSANTLRRYMRDQGLDSGARRQKARQRRPRRRWEAAAPGMLWHADVCHGPNIKVDGKSRPIRIHAILDDKSRYVIQIRAFHTEKEVDMLALFSDALATHGRPGSIYLDNGSTYRGDTLQIACTRLNINLLHAQPYDPEARGKMERFWRTARQRCINYLGNLNSIHDVQARLLAFVDTNYNGVPHSSLLARTPYDVYNTGRIDSEPVSTEEMRLALSATHRRRIRKDGTISVEGREWEVVEGFLAGRKLDVRYSVFDPDEPPVVLYDGREFRTQAIDAVRNGHTVQKRHTQERYSASINPADVALDSVLCRTKERNNG